MFFPIVVLFNFRDCLYQGQCHEKKKKSDVSEKLRQMRKLMLLNQAGMPPGQ